MTCDLINEIKNKTRQKKILTLHFRRKKISNNERMNSQYLLQQNFFVPITIIPFLVITLNSLRELLFFDVRFDVTPSSFLSNVECATSSLVESLSLSHKITRWGETYDLTGRHLLMDETV